MQNIAFQQRRHQNNIETNEGKTFFLLYCHSLVLYEVPSTWSNLILLNLLQITGPYCTHKPINQFNIRVSTLLYTQANQSVQYLGLLPPVHTSQSIRSIFGSAPSCTHKPTNQFNIRVCSLLYTQTNQSVQYSGLHPPVHTSQSINSIFGSPPSCTHKPINQFNIWSPPSCTHKPNSKLEQLWWLQLFERNVDCKLFAFFFSNREKIFLSQSIYWKTGTFINKHLLMNYNNTFFFSVGPIFMYRYGTGIQHYCVGGCWNWTTILLRFTVRAANHYSTSHRQQG